MWKIHPALMCSLIMLGTPYKKSLFALMAAKNITSMRELKGKRIGVSQMQVSRVLARTLAILRQQRALGWETLHVTSAKHNIATAPAEDVDAGRGPWRPAAADGSGRGGQLAGVVLHLLGLGHRQGDDVGPGHHGHVGPGGLEGPGGVHWPAGQRSVRRRGEDRQLPPEGVHLAGPPGLGVGLPRRWDQHDAPQHDEHDQHHRLHPPAALLRPRQGT